ncbi:UAA transporter [Puttea exsequens]|nr:UAA transporter [Puttea exsequens]
MASQASVSISQAGPSEECLTPSAAHPKFGSFAVADRLRDEAVEEGFHPSPIPTPYHTRAGSEEAGGNVRPHSKEQAETFVAKIEERAAEDDLINSKDLEGGDADESTMFEPDEESSTVDKSPKQDPVNYDTSDLSGLTKLDESAMTLVNVVDGSATVSTRIKIKFLMFYFAANMGLTVYNKLILVDFGRPFSLTALHCLGGIVGTYSLHRAGAFTIKPLTAKSDLKLVGFALLYTSNIAVSNVSLAMVTVPFHQLVRAATPAFLVGIYRFIFGNTYSRETYLSLIPLVAGVALVSYGDYSATITGFSVTLLGAMLAALKTMVTNRMQTSGLHLSALELLYRMSPMAFMLSLILAYYNDEFVGVHIALYALGHFKILLILVGNAALAFVLNYTSFSANKKAGALTMTIAGNLKQILIVVFSIVCWDLKVGTINAIGIFATLAGAFWYSMIELVSKQASRGIWSPPRGIH